MHFRTATLPFVAGLLLDLLTIIAQMNKDCEWGTPAMLHSGVEV